MGGCVDNDNNSVSEFGTEQLSFTNIQNNSLVVFHFVGSEYQISYETHILLDDSSRGIK